MFVADDREAPVSSSRLGVSRRQRRLSNSTRIGNGGSPEGRPEGCALATDPGKNVRKPAETMATTMGASSHFKDDPWLT